MSGDKYSQAGVDYDVLDQCKRLAQGAAKRTALHLGPAGFRELESSRGESAYVVDIGPTCIAQVTEALGTKNLVADAMRKNGGRSFYDDVAKDTVATIMNDLCTVGARPVSLTSYWGVGDASWFRDEERLTELTEGWAAACQECEVSWGGGETQVLVGMIEPRVIVLGGSAVGVLDRRDYLQGDRIAEGDEILIAAASGIHANGLTLARKLASGLPLGLETPVTDEPFAKTFGELLLVPTPQYSPLVNALLRANVPLHYAVHVTGHGWRKLMRATAAYTYVIDDVPAVPPVLEFIAKHAGMTVDEAYGTFNMGAGMALYVAPEGVSAAVKAAADKGFRLDRVGRVARGPRAVDLRPVGVRFEGDSLQIRGA